MPKKLFIPLLLVLFLAAACKKESNKPVSLSRSFDFKANAATPMMISISVTRPSGGTSINIDFIGLSNITGPYEYTPANVQAGDDVEISVATTKNQTIASSLKIGGADVANTTSNPNDANGNSSVTWSTVVN
ncbi:MAG TPA: hypothetical protein VL490_07085 [Mucilaginibacter sp.]|jgi:hypothetical protein|nr:hypothetical protein [Mucilaginibacter sp.]